MDDVSDYLIIISNCHFDLWNSKLLTVQTVNIEENWQVLKPVKKVDPLTNRLFMKDSRNYTTFTNLSMKYLVMCKIYTDGGGIK